MNLSNTSRRSPIVQFFYFFNDIVMGVSIALFILICYLWFRASNIWFDPLLAAGIFILISLSLRSFRIRNRVFIKEREFGIVFEKRGNFIRLIDSGYHFIDPLFEELKTTVSKKKHRTGDQRMDMVRTKEGVPVTIYWKAEYFFDIDHILQAQEEDDAYTLLSLPLGKVIGLTVTAIRNAVELKDSYRLYEVQDDDFLLRNFEDLIGESVTNILNEDPLLKKDSYKVFIGPIMFPEKLEQEIVEKSRRLVWVH